MGKSTLTTTNTKETHQLNHKNGPPSLLHNRHQHRLRLPLRRKVPERRRQSRRHRPELLQTLLTLDCDVTNQDSINTAFEKALSHFKRIDVVVNNAGYGLSGEFESLSEAQIRTQMEVNYFGLLNVTRKALETMREVNSPPGGRIQQVTSIGGQRGVPT